MNNMALLTADQGLADIPAQICHFLPAHQSSLSVVVQILQKFHPDIGRPADGVLLLLYFKLFDIYHISRRFQGLHDLNLIHQPPSHGFKVILNRGAGLTLIQHFPDFLFALGNLDNLNGTVKCLPQFLPFCLIYFSKSTPAYQFHSMPGRPYLTDSVHLLIPVLCLLLSNS